MSTRSNIRSLTVLGLVLFAVGLTLGGGGYVTDDRSAMLAGVLLSVPAATALTVGTLRQQVELTDDQLAAAHRAGYELALDHVARGLLDQPSTPTDGGHTDDQLAEVRALPAPRRTTDERAVG